MSMSGYVLAIDQGTTSSRAIVFDEREQIVGMGKMEFTQHFPQFGLGRARSRRRSGRPAVGRSQTATARRPGMQAADIAAIGITNQRETTIVWDRATGKPIHNAIVWQDRRTAEVCDKLKKAGHEKTGRQEDRAAARPLFLRHQDPLDSRQRARRPRSAAEKGELAFGTVDSFLIWRLTGGKVHATDATNASRTLLFNIETDDWDDELLKLLGVPRGHAARGQGLCRRFRRDRCPISSAPPSRSAASPATSRRRPSGRPASSRA